MTQNKQNVPLIFVASFMGLIAVGTLLLLLPQATTTSISCIDALFTATSAVCVTGLVVVDTQYDFTLFGQWIILLLIQLGGLGIMTFTSFFAFFFGARQYSFQTRMIFRESVQMSELGNIFQTVQQIVLITLLIELLGAVAIYYSIKDLMYFDSFFEKLHFSLFHSISAFCNAGFSTLSNSLYESEFRTGYALHWIIAGLLIFGGLGFPITFNIIKIIHYKLIQGWQRYVLFQRPISRPNIFNLNSSLVFKVTILLLVGGTVLFLLLENNHLLAEHTVFEKISLAFFSVASPRTAGFNTIDYSALNISTLLLVILLMWIGASPGSTGGGIKTTTFAIAFWNVWSVITDKKEVEIGYQTIHPASVRRAHAVIVLSFMAVMLTTFLLTILEQEQTLLALLFETVSAVSTAGLSLGITSQLSVLGKVVIIFAMFAGRVGIFTILAGFLRQSTQAPHQYPKMKIFIN